MNHMRRFIFTAAAILGFILGWGAQEAAAGTNVLKVRDVVYPTGQTVIVYVDVTNEDQFKAFEFYLSFAAGLTIDSSSVVLTSRKQDHICSWNKQTDGSWKFIGFSINKLPFVGNNGAILQFTCVVNGQGSYPITVSGAKLIDLNNQYLSVTGQSGQVTIYNPATVAKLRVWARLEGFNQSGNMRTNLAVANQIPLISPYAEAPRTAASVPGTISDWILLELRSSATGAAVYRQSYFLRGDGYVVEMDGTTDILLLGVPPGSYWIILRHRNHAAVMSASPQSLSSSAILFDFTLDGGQYYGNGAIYNNGDYCMPAGDINRDGYLTTKDYVAWYNKQFSAPAAGYHSEDLNGDGLVDGSDFTLWQANARTGMDARVP